MGAVESMPAKMPERLRSVFAHGTTKGRTRSQPVDGHSCRQSCCDHFVVVLPRSMAYVTQKMNVPRTVAFMLHSTDRTEFPSDDNAGDTQRHQRVPSDAGFKERTL